uniref:cellulase n=1 Tax=Antipaluria urichi TaxID=270842 RepID=A0A288QBD2_9NEOP|nr:cellulase [Antipaluria urichi]
MNILQTLLIIAACYATYTEAGNYDYKQVLQKSLLFYEAQRSGKLPSDQKVTWRKDSALNDRGNNGEDLTGGYYDAGDFVKFGFPMAFTATVLAWTIIDHESAYNSAGSMDDARKAVKWATDYFIKCHVDETTLYGQVGNGQLDHNSWGRPEDMTMERPAYKIDASAPGSDLAAETAAAFAAASLVFKSVDQSYSNTLLTHAKQLFDFANNHRAIYSDSIADAKLYYASTSYEDELIWGAAWLYRATNDQSYMSVVDELWEGIMYDDGFGWDNKKSGADVILYKLTQDSKYTDRLKAMCDYVFNSTPRTPKGLIFLGDWGSLRNAANSMFICLEAANLGIDADNYRTQSKSQIDYMLGDGGHSYVVGFGDNYPKYAHHRSSSCPDAPAVCDWNFFGSDQPNAHVLEGALVGGPGQNDDWTDTRQDAQHNEVADDYNAAFQGSLVNLIDAGY